MPYYDLNGTTKDRFEFGGETTYIESVLGGDSKKRLYATDDTGTYLLNSSLFGSHFSYTELETFSTTSVSPILVHSLAVNSLPPGTYRAATHFSVLASKKCYTLNTISINSVQVGRSRISLPKQDIEHCIGFERFVTYTNTSNNFLLEVFASITAGSTATIKGLSISFWRVL